MDKIRKYRVTIALPSLQDLNFKLLFITCYFYKFFFNHGSKYRPLFELFFSIYGDETDSEILKFLKINITVL